MCFVNKRKIIKKKKKKNNFTVVKFGKAICHCFNNKTKPFLPLSRQL